MQTLGRFIVLEGLDGVGKSTLARGLAARLQARVMSTPGESFKSIRNQAMEAFGEDQLARALFYAATVSSEGRKARVIVNKGYTVVMDRYWASTIAYASAREVTADLAALECSLITPDITVLILLDETTRQERLHQRGTTSEDLETISEPFKQAVLAELEKRSNIRVDVSGLNPVDSVMKVKSAIALYFERFTLTGRVNR